MAVYSVNRGRIWRLYQITGYVRKEPRLIQLSMWTTASSIFGSIASPQNSAALMTKDFPTWSQQKLWWLFPTSSALHHSNRQSTTLSWTHRPRWRTRRWVICRSVKASFIIPRSSLRQAGRYLPIQRWCVSEWLSFLPACVCVRCGLQQIFS